MSGIVEFNAMVFRQMYPNIAATETQLEMYFVEATLILDNTKNSHVKNLTERQVLLYLLVAHFAVLQARLDSGNEAVGRIASASEGSVSVAMDNGQTTSAEKWYQQTPYGSKYWALTKKYRSFFYVMGLMPMRIRR